MTAISVARQCGIVNSDLPVYYGDIGEKKVNGKSTIVWKDFESANQTLNPNTLLPLNETSPENIDTPKLIEELQPKHQQSSIENLKRNSDPDSPYQQRFEMMNFSYKKTKITSFFTENYPHMNFRSLNPANKNKYVLSEINSCIFLRFLCFFKEKLNFSTKNGEFK